jgi:hypothetical protein
MRHLPALIAVAALLGTAPAAPSLAQPACPEGRTFAGECVKADLAQKMRTQAIIYSLPKFSYTAPPLLPREDGEYYIPRSYHELRSLYGVESAVPCPGSPAAAGSC